MENVGRYIVPLSTAPSNQTSGAFPYLDLFLHLVWKASKPAEARAFSWKQRDKS